MTREKALEAATKLAKLGYHVSLRMYDMEAGGHGYQDLTRDPDDGLSYDVSIIEISVDKVDLRKLVEVADELELDVGLSPVHGSAIYFSALDGRQAPPEVVTGRRRHPR